MRKIVLSIVFNSAYLFAMAQPGSLDASFGNGGIVNIKLGNGSGYSDMIVQTDGKPICVGSQQNNATYQVGMVRYQLNGTPDSSFGIDGIATSSIMPNQVYVTSVALQPDGKILIAGSYYTSINNNDFIIARYNSNGLLDNSFGTNGVTITPISSTNDDGRYILVQEDGKIILAGSGINGMHSVFVAVRYNTDGTIDNSFSSNGIATVDVASSNSLCTAAALQPDGKILLAGRSNDVDSTDNFSIVRLQTNGLPDSSFGVNGKVVIDNNEMGDNATHVLLQQGGNIIVCGTSATPGSASVTRAVVFRLHADGSRDNSFGVSGGFTTLMSGNGYDVPGKMALQADNKILLGGTTSLPGGFTT